MIRRIALPFAAIVGICAGCAVLWFMVVEIDDDTQTADSKVQQNRTEIPDVGKMEKPPVPPADFVGSESCRECHCHQWEQYQQHPMARSLSLAKATSPAEDFETKPEFAAGRWQYRVERTADGVKHYETALDAAGKTIYDQAVDIQYAVGSSKRGRSYFIDRGGLLYMSPVSWYSEQGSGRWDLSPNFNPQKHLRFERRILDACVSCHVGEAHPRAGEPNHFHSPPFGEISIGCERCHGPGGSHVAFRKGEKNSPQEDPIVNPAHLDPRRRDAVCYQCHLLGQERVLQYGRSEFDFRPGMYLGDVWSVLVEGTGVTQDGATDAVSQAEQMMSSRCYQASSGKLGCTSCHDSHYSPTTAERRVYYRDKCLQCHTDASCRETNELRNQADNDSCMVCHAPRLSATDVPHTSQTDHRILRRMIKGSSEPPEMPTPETIRIFESGTPALAPLAERRARALLVAELAQQQRDVKMAAKVETELKGFARAAPDDVAVLTAIAQVTQLQQRPEEALQRWVEVLVVAPSNETALRSLVALSMSTNRQRDAMQYLERFLIVNPWEAAMHAQQSRLMAQFGRKEEALAEGVKAVELDPSRPENYEWLVRLYTKYERPDEARKYELLLERIAKTPSK